MTRNTVETPAPRTVAVALGRSREIRCERRVLVASALLALTALVVGLAALCYGDGWSSPVDVLDGLTGGGPLEFVVREWRLPRVAAALVFGVALGLGGAVFQNLTRNPLGTPDVIGLDQGAYTGVLVVLTAGGALGSGLVGDGAVSTAAAALIGGLATAAVVYLLAAGPGTDGSLSGLRLIVIGIAVNAVLAAVNTWLVLRADLDSALAATAWSAGSLNGIDWHELALPAATIGGFVVLLAVLARAMQQLALGDDVAATSGVGLRRLRLLLVFAGVGLTATVTAAAGPIIFVALAAPQIGRRLAGSAGVTLLPAALTGAVLLLSADLVAQAALAPIMLPVGVVTSAIGGLYLLWLLVKEVR